MDGRAQTGQRLQQEIASSGQTGLAMPTEQERLAMFKMYVSRLFSQSTPVEETLQEYAEALVQYFSVALVRIWLFDRAGKVLELYSSAGRYTYHDGLHTRISIGQGKIGQIVHTNVPDDHIHINVGFAHWPQYLVSDARLVRHSAHGDLGFVAIECNA